MLENIVQEPFLVLLLSITFINVILITKVIVSRNRIIFFRAASTYPNDLTTFIPVEKEFQVEPDSKQLQQEEKPMRQDSVSFKSDNINRVMNDGKQMQGCNYCLAFYNVGTAICPNCGGLLHLNLPARAWSEVKSMGIQKECCSGYSIRRFSRTIGYDWSLNHEARALFSPIFRVR